MTSEQQPPPPSPEQPDAPADGARPVVGAPVARPADAAPTARTVDAQPDAPAVREVTVRRAPKFVPFMLLGALLGFLAALVLAYTGPVDPTLTRESILGFFTVAFALPGVLLAALLVLLIDRRSVKRAERARAERTDDA